MPLYEYECEACGHRFERIQKFSDLVVKVCPKCSKKTVHKLVSSPAIQFKGSGFYINDYAKKGASGSESEPGQATTTAKSADTKDKSADTKDKSSPASSSGAAPASGSTDTVSAGSSSKDS
jgi:putative FmdB family regulatory protein